MDSTTEDGFPTRDQGVKRQISGQDVDLNAESHRHEAMYIGLRLPHRPRRPRRGSSSHKREKPTQEAISAAASLTPSEQIHLLLSQTEDDDSHAIHDIFCQMDYLFKVDTDMQWREMARWVKYEEDVEQGGERWSKPHVASLSLHSLFELRGSLVSGCVILEMDAYNMTQIADLLLDNLINNKQLEESLRDTVKQAIMAGHVFQHTSKRRRMSTPEHADVKRVSMKRTFSEFGQKFSIRNRDASSNQLRRNASMIGPNMEGVMNGDLPQSASSARLNQQFMRKIPDGSEAANVMVGELEGLTYHVVAFIRLTEARPIGDLTEVPILTRFLFFLFGPEGSQQKITEIGRSMSTIMVDEVFREVAYKARNKQDILAGVDEFLDQVTALPPGEWDPKIRIEPPQTVPSQTPRKVPKPAGPPIEEEEESHCDPTLQRSGRLFGGLVEDIKRKIPFYLSDFKDCLHIQCVASIIYLYLATLTPNVTFGGLLGQATDQYMGTMECILTASIVGVLFALFAGQPLNILGSTGPMLVLEMILYHFCKDSDLDFLPFRCWIGLWTALILLLIVAFDLSALVRYITRFTEESFASLIAIIFIAEAFKKLFGILNKAPINTRDDVILDYNCSCFPPGSDVNISLLNSTFENVTTLAPPVTEALGYLTDAFNSTLNETLANATTAINWTELSEKECEEFGGVLIGSGCGAPHYIADVFFLSVLLFLGTFIISSGLQSFKNSPFFPTYVRQTLSDFAVLIAIVLMVGTDILVGIKTPKLMVPEQFKPTRDDRGWLVNPISDKNPWWLILAAIVPALLATILIFMDQQITAVIVNRKENKLKKGNGYHLDLFVVAICIAICSLLGLPWYVAATVSALAHIISLKKESECTAPGERPTFLGVREQRVTALMVALLSGLSILFTPVLKYIPMAVLYGVFLYMGVSALKGMQFIDRILLLFMPAKYQPDHIYLRHVPIKRCHLFTFLQIMCLVVLWVVKVIKSVSIVFPIMVLGTCFVRKGMDYIFTQNELKWLDDIMPEDKSKRKEDETKIAEDDEGDAENKSLLDDENYHKMMEYKIQDDMMAGKFGMDCTRRGSVDPDRVNITEEMAKTSIWKNVTYESRCENEYIKANKKRKDPRDGKDHKPSFYIQDDDGEPHQNGHGDDRISKV